MRLIDVDAIPENEMNYPVWVCLRKQPTIDAVPVVRCRECKRWDTDPDSYGKDDGPKGKCMKSFEETYDDDFCSYGQRKEATHD